MRKGLILFVCILLVGILSCELPDLGGVSSSERVSLFQAALNADDRTDIYTHFHPDKPERQQVANKAVFDTGSPFDLAHIPFSITITDPGSGMDEKTVVTRIEYNNLGPFDLTFIMRPDGEVWYIWSLTLTVNSTDYTI